MADIMMRFPGGKQKAVTLSYDDGVEQDIRLIEIMKKNGLKGTFNLNSGLYRAESAVYPEGTIHRRLSERSASELYVKSGMEVAVHGLTHPYLEELPDHICMAEILKDRENLEKQFEVIVRGMAYPFGTYSESVIETLKKAGIVYARTIQSTHDFKLPTEWLLLNPTCHHKDPRLMELAEQFLENQRNPHGKPMLFYLWGHSYEFEADDNWQIIEEFADYLGGRDEIWYAANIEIYDYVASYKQLIFSMDGRSAYNPSATDLYLSWYGEPMCIPAGEKRKLY